ncbi:hypothetical protein [Pectinatus frisingensis]|uniref:hypothetical protein n=1 Tax=Pectinatus frisingensis TaxID=865 RepID=UPI0018C47107|nr:hypothetical protein [Pectinatus frisingensis]
MLKMETLSQRLHKDRIKILQFCSHYKNIYLYGAGDCCKLINNYLIEEKINISGVIVSDNHKRSDEFLGYSVYCVSQIKLDEKFDGIIVAVGNKYQKEIIENLKKYRYIKNVYVQKIYCMESEKKLLSYERKNLKLIPNSGYFRSFTELEELGEKFKTDKNYYGHNYLNKYDCVLHHLKNSSFTLLELGVYKGASLKMWGEYFPKANIVGVDINYSCKKYEGKNKHVIIADLSIEKSIIALKKTNPMVIVDDASHLWSHQIKALFLLFLSLPSGGIYILEDLETSFKECSNYGDSIISTYDICSAIAEVVTSGVSLRVKNGFENEIEKIGAEVEMISMIRGSCIIVKK